MYFCRKSIPSAGLLIHLLAATLLTLALPGGAGAAPKADLWPRWEQHDARNGLHIDHGAWSEFLQRNLIAKHPSGISRIRYGDVSRVDRLILDGYIDLLAKTPISTYNRNEQKAYWINLYNALTVQIVLDHYPVDSIRDIDLSPGLFAFGPWDGQVIEVEGVMLTLNDIEHRILRPIWRDPRVHYAVNCASLGCPNLASTAYTVFNMERMLDEAARAYINHPRGVRFDGGDLIVSSIYEWFQEDFGGTDAGVLNHLRQFADPALAERLSAWSGGLDDDYDWTLNAP